MTGGVRSGALSLLRGGGSLDVRKGPEPTPRAVALPNVTRGAKRATNETRAFGDRSHCLHHASPIQDLWRRSGASSASPTRGVLTDDSALRSSRPASGPSITGRSMQQLLT